MITERLKAETLSSHRSAEKALNFERSLSTPEQYRLLLEKFLGFYLPLEEKFLTNLELQKLDARFEARLKVDLLKKDLTQLGSDIKNIPLCQQLPDVSTLPKALGALYVLEGSTLGGQVITKKLKDKNILESSGATFHNPYGTKTMPMWLQFKEILENTDPKQHEDILNSAHETFKKLENWLTEGREIC